MQAAESKGQALSPLHARFGDGSWADSPTRNGGSWLSRACEDKVWSPIGIEDLTTEDTHRRGAGGILKAPGFTDHDETHICAVLQFRKLILRGLERRLND